MAERSGGLAEPGREWWRSPLVVWPVGSVVTLVLGGLLVSSLFPTNTYASLATGMAWSLAWLTALVVLGSVAVSKVRALRR